MAYAPQRNMVQEITVDARVAGQQVINIFYFRATTPDASADGSSQTLLTAFRTAWRANIIPNMLTSYFVARYTMVEIIGTTLVAAGPPAKIRKKYHPAKREVIPGIAASDTGTNVGTKSMPLHECLRANKVPSTLYRGFYSGAYTRFAPMTEDHHSDTEPEKWVDAHVTTWNGVLAAMLGATYSDGGGVNPNWNHALFSAPYYQNHGIPAGMTVAQAAPLLTAWIASPYVGTQVSRRYSPLGTMVGD